MSEGRQSQVVLLDDRRLDILIKPKLYAGELLDMVASHFSLKEKEYFGLAYVDDTGHYSWLQLDRRILEHEFPKKSAQSTLILLFKIKYFVESIAHLRDSTTVEAFYLQAQSLVYQGSIEVCSDKTFHLAALVIQATHGDYIDDETTKGHLKKLPVIPTSTLLEHPSLTVCEDRIIEVCQSLKGLSRGTAIVRYMQVLETLPTYGVHYYEVKDKAGIPWWLGISYRGICQYDQTDKKIPRKIFLWKQLENLYFRDRKFSIEVNDPKRGSSGRKAFGSGNISVYVWFASTPSLTKSIWSMAIAQHQFYLDRKHNKVTVTVSRNLTEIATELSHDGVHSISTDSSSLNRSASTHSLPALKIDSDFGEDKKAETLEMLVSLKARKEALEEALHKKSEELKKLCLQEGELTGVLPPEMPLSPGEKIPRTKKKMGSMFSLKERLMWKKKTKEEEELARLQLEYEIQNKITTAAYKLANDPNSKKSVRRQRKISHQKAQLKLKEIENKLLACRKQIEALRKEHLRQCSDDERSEDNVSHSTDESDAPFRETSLNQFDRSITFSPPETVKEDAKNSINKVSLHCPSPISNIIHTSNSNSAPSSPMKSRQRFGVQRSSPDKAAMTDRQGYTPSSVYQTQTSYRSQQYPTLSMRLPSSYSAGAVLEYCENNSSQFCNRANVMPTLMSPYQNKFESTLDIEGSNLYSVPTQRTSQAFDTQDDILASLPNNHQDLGLMSRHNSLDRTRRQSVHRYRRYIENTQPSIDVSRPSSVQPSLSYNEPLSYVDTHPHYQTRHDPLDSQTSSYAVHHPHHFHHHRHREQVTNHGERTSRPSTKKDKCKDLNLESQLHINNLNYTTYCENAGLRSSFSTNSDHQSFATNECQAYLPNGQFLQPEIKSGNQGTNTMLCNCCAKPYNYCLNRVYQDSEYPLFFEDGQQRLISDETYNQISSQTTKNWVDFSNSQSINKYQPPKTNQYFRTSPADQGQHDHSLPVGNHADIYSTDKAPKQLSPNQSNVEVSVLSYGHFQPYWEETKPYETSDFYKYSTKHRKQHQVASQNLHAKLAAWKANQGNLHYQTLTPKVMSPVFERSHTASPACNFSENFWQSDTCKDYNSQSGETFHSDTRADSNLSPETRSSNLSTPSSDKSSNMSVAESFHSGSLERHTKTEKLKKTTLV